MARQPAHQTKPNPEKNPRRDPTAAGQRDAAVNRIASHNYFLLEQFEAGVALTGTEVKSVRAGPNRGPRGKGGCRPGKKEIVRNPVRRLVREKSERHGHPRAARLPSLTVRSALLSPTQLESLFQAAQLA